MKVKIIIVFCIFVVKVNSQTSDLLTEEKKEQIIETYLTNGAWNHHFLSKEWHHWIDLGLKQDSTIAYLWQQKALPYWKQNKYQLAIEYYENAVKYDRKEWLSRLGFLKCIFAKDYSSALVDLNNYSTEFGLKYEQDHSLEFYQGLCYLQLNQFDKVFLILDENVAYQEKKYGENFVHYLDRFYLALAYYELNNYEKASTELDKVLEEYSNSSDAQYYKALCLKYLNQEENAKTIFEFGKSNFKKGYTFNEDSNKYEDYPYQITWQWETRID